MWFEFKFSDRQSLKKRVEELEKDLEKVEDAIHLGRSWVNSPKIADVLAALARELAYEITDYGLKKKEK